MSHRFAILDGVKVAVVTQRLEAKDYVDIHAMILAGLTLPEMLAAASAIYEDEFNPLVALKAIAYHEDLAPGDLSAGARRDLSSAVKSVDARHLPVITATAVGKTDDRAGAPRPNCSRWRAGSSGSSRRRRRSRIGIRFLAYLMTYGTWRTSPSPAATSPRAISAMRSRTRRRGSSTRDPGPTGT